MNIFVKYCGGCNPRYDRTEIIKRLKEDLKDIYVMPYFDDKVCDFVLVISGCSASCTNHEKLHGRFGKMVIRDIRKYSELKYQLEEIKREEKNGLE